MAKFLKNKDYIKSLYKKYLGKENQNRSDRKQRTDSGVVKNLFGREGKVPQTATKQNDSVFIQASLTQESVVGKKSKEMVSKRED